MKKLSKSDTMCYACRAILSLEEKESFTIIEKQLLINTAKLLSAAFNPLPKAVVDIECKGCEHGNMKISQCADSLYVKLSCHTSSYTNKLKRITLLIA